MIPNAQYRELCPAVAARTAGESSGRTLMCSPFITTNVRWLDAKTFHFTSMETSGFKNHSRDGGWNRGTFKQTDHPFTVEHDRDIEFLVDKADVDESNATASIQNIARVFTETQSGPEKDALFFSKVAAAAKKQNGYHTETDPATITKENVYSYLKKCMAAGKLRRYKARGGLICYVASFIMDALEQSPDFTRTINVTQVADGGDGVETRITDIDGVPIMEVIDDEVFYDAFKFDGENGGFEPIASTSHKINASDRFAAHHQAGAQDLQHLLLQPRQPHRGRRLPVPGTGTLRRVYLPQRQGRQSGFGVCGHL